MSNIEILEKLMKGAESTETIIIEDEEIIIRPLTSGELSELQSIEKKSFTMKVGLDGGKRTGNMNDVNVNAGNFTKYQNEALYTAVAWGLSINGKSVKPSQVQNLPAGIPEQIFQEIIRISNVNNNDLTIIKTFRADN